MEKQVIDKAVKVINKAMRRYQRMLTFQLELRAEAKLQNGNLKDVELGDYESNIEKYEIVLSDLATIKRAIKNEQGDWCQVLIQGTADDDESLYHETYGTLETAGFYIDGGPGYIILTSMEIYRAFDESAYS
ncbi:MAG: hypothetical protein HFJ50_02300 [Clostridia bacterium]|jgi:hypothetical protein|nr:hypothetical protein [Clostridia bacterium]